MNGAADTAMVRWLFTMRATEDYDLSVRLVFAQMLTVLRRGIVRKAYREIGRSGTDLHKVCDIEEYVSEGIWTL